MIISRAQVQNILKIYGKEMNSNKVDKNQAVKAAGKKDQLDISGESRVKQKAMQAIKQSEDIRQDKVDQLREQISAGTYEMSDDAVAEKMIARAIVDRLI